MLKEISRGPATLSLMSRDQSPSLPTSFEKFNNATRAGRLICDRSMIVAARNSAQILAHGQTIQDPIISPVLPDTNLERILITHRDSTLTTSKETQGTTTTILLRRTISLRRPPPTVAINQSLLLLQLLCLQISAIDKSLTSAELRRERRLTKFWCENYG